MSYCVLFYPILRRRLSPILANIVQIGKCPTLKWAGNTIEYEVKSYQVKTTIVKCTKVRIKGLKFNRSQIETLVWPTSGKLRIYVGPET